MHEWFYVTADKQRQGPVSSAQILHQLHTGALSPESLIWRQGMSNWQPLRLLKRVLEADGMPLVPGQDAPPGEFHSSDIFHAAQSVTENGPGVEYAGFWRRVAAYIIDFLILFIPQAIVETIAGISGSPVMLLISIAIWILAILYFPWFHASRYQATPGKMALGIQVVNLEMQRIGFWRAVGRYFATILSSIILCIGFMMAGWTKKKQALHDMICSTLVIKKPDH